MKLQRIVGVVAFSAVLISAAGAQGLSDKEKLGKNLFFDDRLSMPSGQACSDCHSRGAGFNGIGDAHLAVYQGAVPNAYGNRNPPAAAYASFSPVFHYDYQLGGYVGGQFWDGRAATLKEQAKGPFLNPKEQNNRSKAAVVLNVATSNYSPLFRSVYGKWIFARTEVAYDAIADAIAAYESSDEVNRFSSKYDLYLSGDVSLTPVEAEGLTLFNGKAGCSACHPSTTGRYAERPLFTDYTYDNLGMPRNPDNPYYRTDPSFIDLGLGGVLNDGAQYGKFKVPTLRNIAIAPPYGHNGYFRTLKEIVEFYNTRDIPAAGWPPPEVAENINVTEVGDLKLTEAEVDALVAFLETLNDGYLPPNPR